MKIIITGAGGQLGQALQTLFKNHPEHRVVALTRQQLDITSGPRVDQALSENKPDLVINTAAYNQVDKAESEPDQAMVLNAKGPENLAIATGKLKIPLLHFSTDYVFDGTRRVPYIESDETHPLSVYGESKLAGEKAVLAHNPKSWIVRTAWLYHIVGKNFPVTMLSLRQKPEIRVVNDQFGSPTYAPHLAEMVLNLIGAQETPFGVYHMAGLGGVSWYEFATEIFRKAGLSTILRPISLNEYTHAAPRPKYTVLATDREPAFILPPWEQGVADFVKAYKETYARSVPL